MYAVPELQRSDDYDWDDEGERQNYSERLQLEGHNVNLIAL